MKIDPSETFSYNLLPLPHGETISLAEAMQFAMYGGIPTVHFSQPIPLLKLGNIQYFERSDGTRCIEIEMDTETRSHKVFVGPKRWEIASPEAILYGTQGMLNEEDRRRGAFERALCTAAHENQLIIYGFQVNGVLGMDTGNPSVTLTRIPATYFAAWRGYDEASNRIDAISVYDSGNATTAIDHEIFDDTGSSSYVAVRFDRVQYIKFLTATHPALVNKRIQKKARILAKENQMANELAAKITANLCGTREQEATNLGLGSHDRSFARIWMSAHQLTGVTNKGGAPRGPRKPPH